MNIGLEASSILTSNPSGVSRYIKELVIQLLEAKEADDSLTLLYKLSRWKKRHLWWRSPDFMAKAYHNILWPLHKHVDFFHILDPTNILWSQGKSGTASRMGITIHDMLVLLNDDSCVARDTHRIKKARQYKYLVEKADAIFTVSKNTKKDVVQILGVPEEKVHVTYLGIDHGCRKTSATTSRQVLETYGLHKGYLLFVGAISGRKNTERLVRAYAKTKAARERQLVLAGPVSFKGEETTAAIRDCGVGKKVVITGYLPEDHLGPIYSNASAFVFPTLYEGFGMPILEAMDWGVPVLTSSIGAAPEVSGGHAVCVDPYDIDAIADGIEHVLSMDTDKLMKAKKHARAFTWQRCAEQTINIYRNLL